MAVHGLIPLLVSMKKTSQPVRLVVVSGVSLEIMIGSVGRDVVSGETVGPHRVGVVIPLSSVAWIDSAGALSDDDGADLAEPEGPNPRPSCAGFVENSRRLSHTVTLHTGAGALTGLIRECSSDVIALAEVSGRSRVVATSSVLWFSVDGGD